MEEIAKLFGRHLLIQQREAFVENSILRHLLQKEHPTVPKEIWDKLINTMKEDVETTKKIREPFDLEAEKVMKVFSEQVKVAKMKAQVIEEQKKIEQAMNELATVMSKLPLPKLPN